MIICYTCRHAECLGNLFIEIFGRHQCERCDLIKQYKELSEEYSALCKEGRLAEADEVKKKLMSLVDEQTRQLKGGAI